MSTRALLPAWLALCGLLAVLALRDLDVPGPYYDEVIQALPAVEFLDGARRAAPLPGSQVLSVSGRPFPWLTQAYMGALKSQLLIPVFALAGHELFVLRLASVAWSALGLLLCMAFAQRAFGAPVALLCGLLLVLDPSFVFMSRHDWGSFPLGLALRCASLLLALLWWQSGRLGWAVLAGAALGLGVYNKIDFALFPAAAVLALLLVGRGALLRALRERRAATAALAAAAALAALPILVSLPELFGEAGRLDQQVGFTEKRQALAAVLDGSYFLRLMRVGGRFDAMHALGDVPSSGFGLLCAAAALGLTIACARGRAPRGAALLLVCGLALAALHLALPGGARAHHLMNLYPFPHWIAALGLVALWRAGTEAGRGPRRVRRALAAAALLAVVFAGARLVEATRADLLRSGGRGYWSDAIVGFAAQTALSPDATVVCLDWGLHNALAFLGDGVRSIDAPWALRRAALRGERWGMQGDAATRYLIHPAPLDLFGLGRRFEAALAALPPDAYQVTPHADREGAPAFLAVRFAGRHQVVYDGAGFAIAVEPAHPG